MYIDSLNNNNIGKNIQKIREEKGLNKSNLAELLYVSSAAVGQWESGKKIPTFENILLLCDCLHCNIEELLIEGK